MPQLGLRENGIPQFDKTSLPNHSSKEPKTVKNDSELLSPKANPMVRRLSSHATGQDDLASGPTVIVPPKDLHKPSDAHETAAALELAKHRLNIGDGVEPSTTPLDTKTADSYAFGFDIDGVLVRGGQPIPEAIEAMKVLNGQNEWGIKVSVYRFLSCQSLSDRMAAHTYFLPMAAAKRKRKDAFS